MGFKRFLAIRALSSVAIFFASICLTFIIFRLVPGDPAAYYVDPQLPENIRIVLINQLGFNKPVSTQFYIFVVDLFKGNLGESFSYQEPVLKVLEQRIGNTLVLAGAAALITFSLAYVLGRLAGIRNGGKFEKVLSTLISTLGSIPLFVVGLLAIEIFSVKLGVLPFGLTHNPSFTGTGLSYYFSLDYLHHLILPAFTLGITNLVFYYLIVKNASVKALQSDYVLYLRERGASESVIAKHVGKNIRLPFITVIANYVAIALGGQVIIETVFSWIGLGFTIISSIDSKDYPLAEGAFILIAAVAVCTMFVADLVYGLSDPRVRYQ